MTTLKEYLKNKLKKIITYCRQVQGPVLVEVITYLLTCKEINKIFVNPGYSIARMIGFTAFTGKNIMQSSGIVKVEEIFVSRTLSLVTT